MMEDGITVSPAQVPYLRLTGSSSRARVSCDLHRYHCCLETGKKQYSLLGLVVKDRNSGFRSHLWSNEGESRTSVMHIKSNVE
jgi:hypothetical protein